MISQADSHDVSLVKSIIVYVCPPFIKVSSEASHDNLNFPKVRKPKDQRKKKHKLNIMRLLYKGWIKVSTTLLSHGDGDFESCQLPGHEQGLLGELV